ncbi:MAG: hypothetical protein SPL14_07610 [Candidatus Onthomorpha sp.]|nr:hypothetical protein [Bacteroidales bacterium]MCI7407375.1 hypothetical protein [Bacteroidales bacterium]MDD7484547.1 hypothetical protein [Bacteroidales bacterium]MDY5699277.1 hypothetical protein [Candidatus Onthomorpha sp.]
MKNLLCVIGFFSVKILYNPPNFDRWIKPMRRQAQFFAVFYPNPQRLRVYAQIVGNLIKVARLRTKLLSCQIGGHSQLSE